MGASPASVGVLLYGSDFVRRVQELARMGLVEEGQRHDAALKLIWYWVVCRGLSEEEAVDRLADWLHEHNHASHLLPAHPRKFIRNTLREARHYARSLSQRRSGRWAPPAQSVDVAPPALDQAEDAILARVAPELRADVRAILRHLRTHADAAGRVPHPVNLSGRILEGICGDRRIQVDTDGVICRRRSYVVAVERLVELGILALHTNYSTGRHGKLYTCWYQFGSGALPADDRGVLVLAERDIEEGRLQVVTSDAQMPAVRLEPNERTLAPAGPLASPASFGRLWWVRMFQRRAFTPAEFLEGDARKIIPGPFRHRFPSSTAPPVEIVQPRAASSSTDPVTAAEDLGRPRDSHEVAPEPDPAPRFARAGDLSDPERAKRRPPAPDRAQFRSPELTSAGPPPDALPPDIEELLSLMPAGPLREQVRSTWRDWLQREGPGDSS
jgi:hypothetical protein